MWRTGETTTTMTTATNQKKERWAELKTDWFEVKWWEELGKVMSQFHMGVKMRLIDDNSGWWVRLHAQW